MRASCLAFCNECCKEGSLEQESLRDKQVGSKRPAAASGCGGAGPSASSALLSDAPRHRPRRASLHPAPRRSQRRRTPFFSSLLAARNTMALEQKLNLRLSQRLVMTPSLQQAIK